MLKKLLTTHWVLTFIIMLLTAVGFGLTSFNLFFLLKANLRFIAEHGAMALAEGGLVQLAELVLTGIVSAAFYVVFRASERVLVEKVLR